MHGYDTGEVVSAIQKCIRRSAEPGDKWERDCLFFAMEMHWSGFGGWVWKRISVIASEDVGVAWLEGPAVIRALRLNYEEAVKGGKSNDGERLYLMHAVMLLCRAPKSREACSATVTFSRDVLELPEIPDVAFDRHTLRGKRMGRSWDHFWTEGAFLAREVDEPDRYLDGAKEALERQPGAGVVGAPRESGPGPNVLDLGGVDDAAEE